MRVILTSTALLLLILLGRSASGDEGAPRGPSTSQWSLKPSVTIDNYGINRSHAFFSDQKRYWLETSVHFGGKLQYQRFTAEVKGIGVKTSGRDPYGTGSAPAFSPPGTEKQGRDPAFDLDVGWVQWQSKDEAPVKITVGRQYIAVGTQFLIGDGVLDGFHADTQQGVFHNPRRGFDAVRAEFSVEKTRFDAFIYRVDPTWDAGGKNDGRLAGVDVTRASDRTKGTYSGGLFYRSSRSNLDNDTAILNVRVEQRCPKMSDFYASGECVLEFAGVGQNRYYVTPERLGKDMNENAWHAEIGYQTYQRRFMPFAEAGYVSYSTGFTPIATGFYDWGKWYWGNQVVWLTFGHNARIIRGQVGFFPLARVKVRAQYHNTRQIVNTGTSNGGTLADEFGIIGQWFPNDRMWASIMVGYDRPGSALGPSGINNPLRFFNSDATLAGTKSSVDVILALSVSY